VDKLETFNGVAQPEQDKTYNDEPECITGNERNADKAADQTQSSQHGRDPEHILGGGCESHGNPPFIILHARLY